MPNLLNTLNDLANSFASSVLDVIRNASIEELSGGVKANASSDRPSRPSSGTQGVLALTKAPKRKAGRLARRSPEQIAETLETIVALLKSKKSGLRAEQVRRTLDLDVREMPRVLKEGLVKRKLKSKGQKRATTYFAA
jgi:hypothetical protein